MTKLRAPIVLSSLCLFLTRMMIQPSLSPTDVNASQFLDLYDEDNFEDLSHTLKKNLMTSCTSTRPLSIKPHHIIILNLLLPLVTCTVYMLYLLHYLPWGYTIGACIVVCHAPNSHIDLLLSLVAVTAEIIYAILYSQIRSEFILFFTCYIAGSFQVSLSSQPHLIISTP